MKRKIRCICIDGMEKTGRSSIIRQVRKHLKNKNKDLHDIKGATYYNLEKQEAVLQDNRESIVLKENGIMSILHDNFKQFKNIKVLMEELEPLLNKEKNINHQYGAVNFFLLPENIETAKAMFGSEEIPSYYNDLIVFYKGINQTSITQGLDVKLIPFNQNDKIFDVRDKVLEIIEQKYQI